MTHRVIRTVLLGLVVVAITLMGACEPLDEPPSRQVPPEEEFDPDPEPLERELGLILIDVEAYRAAPIIHANPVALPSAVDISIDAPFPGDQGPQGSCVGWAAAYILKTYHERIERGWRLTDNRHVMSPAYIYNQIKQPGGGAFFEDAFVLLADQGVSSWAAMPYNWQDDQSQPSAAAREEAANYRIASWGTVQRTTHAIFVREIKRHLADGVPVVIGIPVYSDFDTLDESNPVYDDGSGAFYGFHAVVIVGYDDARSAFKVANSWGTDWGIGGYGWIDYAASERLIREAYVTQDMLDDDPDPDPEPPKPPEPQAPVPVGTIAAITLTVGSAPVTVDVARNFRDPDSQTLTYSARSSAPAVATASVAGSTVTVWAVAQGNATVTVTATDEDSLTATQTFSVTVNTAPPEPQAPVPVGTIAAITLTVGDAPVTVDVARNFRDPDSQTLTYSARSSAPAVATASAAGSTVTVWAVAQGAANITVTATDEDNLTATQTFSVTVNTAPPESLPKDYRVLLSIKDDLIGDGDPSTLNWSTTTELWAWTGVYSWPDDRVFALDLAYGTDGKFLPLRGTIPPELDNLASLVDLDLSQNELSGPLPASLGNLTELSDLDLSYNELSGPLPISLGNLSELRHLDLYANELSGPIPSSLGNLAEQIYELDLSFNNLTGCIPAALSEFRAGWYINPQRGGRELPVCDG